MPDPKYPSTFIDHQMTQDFLSLIQRDKNPLSHPELFTSLPFNYATNRPFTASNLFRLMMRVSASETSLSPCWVTMDVVKEKGAHFSKDDSARLQLWKKTTDTSTSFVTYPLKKGGEGVVRDFNGEKYELRTFYVVNANHLQGMAKPLDVAPKPSPQPEKIHALIEAVGVKFQEGKLFQGKYAFYFNKSDTAVIPKASETLSQTSVDLTKLEMSLHGLLQSSRGGKGFVKPFPTPEEELSVRLATMVLANEANMDLSELFKSSAPKDRYWKELCERQPSLLRQACTNSAYLVKKAHQLQRQHLQTQEQTTKQDKTMSNRKRFENIRKSEWTGEMVVLPEKQVGKRLVVCPKNEASTFGVYGRLLDHGLVKFSRASTLKEAEDVAMKFGALRNPQTLQFNEDNRQTEKLLTAHQPSNVKYVDNVYSRNPDVFRENKAMIRLLKGGYDSSVKRWFVPKDTPDEALKAFQEVAPTVHISPEEEFRQALVSYGFDLERHTFIADGQLHRCPLIDDKSGERSGSYIYHPDGIPAGMIQNFRTGEKTTWRPQSSVQLTAQEQREARERLEAQIAKRREEQAQIHRQVADDAKALVEACTKTNTPTAYLERKGFTEADLGLLNGILVNEDNKLIVPIRDENAKIWSYQTIDDNGFKSLAKGGKKSGNYALIGNDDKATSTIICEGYATGLSIALATRQPVVVAMDAGNLLSVAKKMKAKYPERPILICGDDDRYGQRNQGREKALLASKAVDGLAVFPVFTTVIEGQKPTDFNDLAQIPDGRDQVELQLMSALSDLRKQTVKETPQVERQREPFLSR